MNKPLPHDGWDVIVCGGGPAGLATALSAARNQARTLLIEAAGCLGGMSTAGNVPAFCPYENGPLLIRGIGLEVIEELKRRGGGGRNPEQVNWLPIAPETLKQIYDDLLTDAGVSLRFFTTFADVGMKNSVVETLFTESKAGREAWSARVFVDATGDADIAVRSGASFAQGDEQGKMQAATLCFSVGGIDMERADRFALEKGFGGNRPLRSYLKEVKKTALTNPGDRNVNLSEARKGVISFNYNHVYGVDGTNPDDLTRAMIDGRRIAAELVEYLRANVPGCERAFLVCTAQLPGIRETRRIAGDYTLDETDFREAKRHEDDIAVYAYPIDAHPAQLDQTCWKEFERQFASSGLPPGKFYGIPYRSLLPRGIENLLVAGRAISCDRAMQSSLRVMPACFAMGQAAGAAAAMAAHGDTTTRGVDVTKLQALLRKQGAYILDKGVV